MKYINALLPILAGSKSEWWWILIIVGIFAVIVVAVILIKRHVKVFQNPEKPKTDKEIAKEELDRILEPIEEIKTEEEETEEK